MTDTENKLRKSIRTLRVLVLLLFVLLVGSHPVLWIQLKAASLPYEPFLLALMEEQKKMLSQFGALQQKIMALVKGYEQTKARDRLRRSKEGGDR
jgi:hypothetical protein